MRSPIPAYAALLLFLTTLSGAAQGSEDVVLLKDGSEIKGTVIAQQPGQFVTVRTADGREVTLSWDDVRRIDRGSPPTPVNPAPEAAPAPAPAPTPPPAPAAPTTTESPASAPSAKPGLGFSHEVTFEESEARRNAWLAKGGGIIGYEVRGFGMFVMLPPVEVRKGTETTGLFPSNDVETLEKRGIGGGGGAGFRVAYMGLSLPDVAKGGGWSALRIAAGADFSYAYIGFPVQSVETRFFPGPPPATAISYGYDYEGTSLLLLNVPVQLGGMIGLGDFDGLEWRGVALSASWSPSLTYAKAGEGDGSTDFNYLGFELGLDILGKDGPMEAQAPRAHGKVFGFLLPPIGDLPLVATLGGGAVWY